MSRKSSSEAAAAVVEEGSTDDYSFLYAAEFPSAGDFEDFELVEEPSNKRKSTDDSKEENANESEAAKSRRKNSTDSSAAAAATQPQAPPTHLEMSELSSLENYQSSLFKLQIAELLKEISLPAGLSKPIEAELHAVRAHITAIPTRALSFTAGSFVLGVEFPHAVNFTFLPSSRLDLVGSHLLSVASSVASSHCFDVAMEIPRRCLQEKDYLNGKYLYKRIGFLQAVAESIKENEKFRGAEIRVEYWHGDKLKPIIILQPMQRLTDSAHPKAFKGLAGDYRIRLIPSIPADLFPDRKLAPNKNNIRKNQEESTNTKSQIKTESKTADSDSVGASAVGVCTPFYNSQISSETQFVSHLRFLHEIISPNPNIRDAAILTQLWSKQRGIARRTSSHSHSHSSVNYSDSSKSCFPSIFCSQGDLFGNFHFLMLIAHLFLIKSINAHMNSYQIFRQLMNFLAREPLEKGIFMGKIAPKDGIRMPAFANSNSLSSADQLRLSEFLPFFPFVFLDSSGRLISEYISASAFAHLRLEAARSLSLLDHSNSAVHDSFPSLFIRKLEFLHKFDVFARIKIPTKLKNRSALKKNFQLAKLNGAETNYSAAYDTLDSVTVQSRFLYDLLSRGLSDRADLIHIEFSESGGKAGKYFLVALAISPINSTRLVDMGPAAELIAASAEFRSFWGSKSSLRRFKDGNICEAAIWSDGAENGSGHEKPNEIIEEITFHLLEKHFPSVDLSSVSFISGSQFHSLLLLRKSPNEIPSFDPMNSVGEIQSAFLDLQRSLKSLDIPLSIISIRSFDPLFRQTAVFPNQPILIGDPQLHSASDSLLSPFLHPIPVLLQFESNNRWPQDPVAIARIKAAFYLKFANEMNKKFPNIFSSVANDSVTFIHRGFPFQLEIYYDKEILIRSLMEKSSQIIPRRSGLFDIQSKFDLELRYSARPELAQRIRNFSSKFPLFSSACRLFKRWISSHWFDSINEETAELLAVAAFQTRGLANSSLFSGFYRILDFISTFDFSSNPLLITFDEVIPADKLELIQINFENERKNNPENRTKLLYLATEFDTESKFFNQSNQGEIERFLTFVRTSKAFIDEAVNKFKFPGENAHSSNSLLTIFKTPLEQFDLLISFDLSKLPRNYFLRSINKTAAVESASAAENENEEKLRNSKKKKKPLVKPFDSRPADEKQLGSGESNPFSLINYTPIRDYLSDLRRLFSYYAEFSYDRLGGSYIGVQWKRDLMTEENERKSFSVKQSGYAKPVMKARNQSQNQNQPIEKSKQKSPKNGKSSSRDEGIEGFQLDYQSIITDIKRIGEGIIDDIQIRAGKLTQTS